MVFPIGAAIGAGASILGGILGNDSAEKQMEMQKEFAQKGIRWKVADAKAAGIHPLYALGAPTISYSPVATGDYGVSQAGQDIGRAIDATRTESERNDAITGAMAKLQLENQQLQNDGLRLDLASKTARLQQSQNPPMPSGDSEKPTKLPDPTGFFPGGWTVRHPNFGQDAENAYSEWANVLTGLSMANDARLNFEEWARQNFGVAPDWLNPWMMGTATSEWLKRKTRSTKGGGSGW